MKFAYVGHGDSSGGGRTVTAGGFSFRRALTPAQIRRAQRLIV